MVYSGCQTNIYIYICKDIFNIYIYIYIYPDSCALKSTCTNFQPQSIDQVTTTVVNKKTVMTKLYIYVYKHTHGITHRPLYIYT